LPLIYSAPSLDFNDITLGSNGAYAATAGYDLVTGRGTPKADPVVYSLIGQNFSLSNGVLTVNGDQLGPESNDTVTLGLTSSGGVQVTLNGDTASFDPGTVTSVDINLGLDTGGGNDLVNIEATAPGVAVTVDLGYANGTVNISPSAKDLDTIQGSVSVNGGTGADVLNIDDQNDPYQVRYSITSSTVHSSNAAPISYSSMSRVNLYGGNAEESLSGGDTYNIESTVSGTATSIGGGDPDDVFNNSPSAKNLDNIQGSLSIAGPEPTRWTGDTLNVYDQNFATTTTYSLTSSTITRSGAAQISYASQEKVDLYGGSGSDSYNWRFVNSG
jgi:hypothetical protein